MSKSRLVKGQRSRSTEAKVDRINLSIDARIRLLESFAKCGVAGFKGIRFSDKEICKWNFPDEGIFPIGSVNTLKARKEKLLLIHALVKAIPATADDFFEPAIDDRTESIAHKNREIKRLKATNQMLIDDLAALRCAYLDLLSDVNDAAEFDLRRQEQVRRHHRRWGVVEVVAAAAKQVDQG